VEDLLTTKELQALLKVDRTTIYRMLKDGRIAGIRVGGQWRFSREGLEHLLSGASPSAKEAPPLPADVLPLHCIKPIQQVFAEIAQVGSLTAAPDGIPLTEISNSCAFCALILGSESGKAGCIASWKRIAQQPERKPRFATCHAGLQYARARIEINGELAAVAIAGQFYAKPPDPQEEQERLTRLASDYGVDHETLERAARSIRVLDERHEEQIGGWLQKVANTFEGVGRERAALMNRLRRIADMSTLSSEQ
jgi:excisionase family DNA binding protein